MNSQYKDGVNPESVERFVVNATGEELRWISAAVGRRARELGLSPREVMADVEQGDEEPPASEVIRRLPHEGGELTLETRGAKRKDGSTSRHGPYWYFRWREGKKQRVLYLGKTDEPVQLLYAKRSKNHQAQEQEQGGKGRPPGTLKSRVDSHEIN